VVLFKPQFELDRRFVGRDGVVRDEAAVAEALTAFGTWCREHGFEVRGQAPSELSGPAGNREIFFHLKARP
jgi:23S rRNA (cytidine1920-2'-O)/16S rRNA (cytidine1409-2'-O)-methyltransferase